MKDEKTKHDRSEAMREIVQDPKVHVAGMKYIKAIRELRKLGIKIIAWEFDKDREEFDMEFCHEDTGEKAWATIGRY